MSILNRKVQTVDMDKIRSILTKDQQMGYWVGSNQFVIGGRTNQLMVDVGLLQKEIIDLNDITLILDNTPTIVKLYLDGLTSTPFSLKVEATNRRTIVSLNNHLTYLHHLMEVHNGTNKAMSLQCYVLEFDDKTFDINSESYFGNIEEWLSVKKWRGDFILEYDTSDVDPKYKNILYQKLMEQDPIYRNRHFKPYLWGG